MNKVQTKFKKPVYVIPGHDDGTNTESLNHTLKLVNDYLAKPSGK